MFSDVLIDDLLGESHLIIEKQEQTIIIRNEKAVLGDNQTFCCEIKVQFIVCYPHIHHQLEIS